MRFFCLALLLIASAPLAARNNASTGTAPEMVAGDPAPQSFEVFAGDANESTQNRGMTGGGGSYHARVTVAPRYELPGDGTVRILLGSDRVTADVIERRDPGGLALITWSIDLSYMDDPSDRVRAVTARFDGGATAVSEQAGAGTYVFPLPNGASRLEGFRVAWEWKDQRKTLDFEAQDAGFPSWPWWLAGAAAAVSAIAFLARKRRGAGPPAAAKAPNEEDEEEEKDRFTLESSSASRFRLAAPGESDLAVDLSDEQGLSITGLIDAGDATRGWSVAVLQLDTATGTALHDLMIVQTGAKGGIDPNLPLPTAAGAEAYRRAWVLTNMVQPAGNPSGPGPDMARAPAILCGASAHPNPGETLQLRGLFGEGGDLKITFSLSSQPEPPADGQKQRESDTIRVEHAAELLSRSNDSLLVRIPNVPKGKYFVVVTRDGLASQPYKFRVYPPGEAPPLSRQLREELRNTAVAQILNSEAFHDLVRLGHVLTRKEGRFRYLLGSKSADVEIDGRRTPCRWLVLLDGLFEDGFKDATFRMRAALVESEEADRFLDGAAGLEQRLVDVLEVSVDDDDGRKYTAKLLPGEDDLAEALGIEWDQDSRRLTLTSLLSFSLPERGLKVFFDSRAKQAGFELEQEGRTLALAVGEEGAQLTLSERDTRVVDGLEQHTELNHRMIGDNMFTELKGRFALQAGQSVSDPAANVAELTVRFDENGIPRGDPIANFGGTLTLSYGGAVRMAMSANARENRLHDANAALTLTDGKDNVTLNFDYSRQPDAEDSGARRDQWGLGVAAQTELLRGRVRMKANAQGIIERERSRVNSIELLGSLEVRVKKAFDMTFGLQGQYRREFGREPNDTVRVLLFGKREILKTEIMLGLGYVDRDGRAGAELTLDIDFGGVIEQGLKRFKQDNELRRVLWQGGHIPQDATRGR